VEDVDQAAARVVEVVSKLRSTDRVRTGASWSRPSVKYSAPALRSRRRPQGRQISCYRCICSAWQMRIIRARKRLISL